MAGLDAVIPFLEIPDVLYKPGSELSGPHLVAINAGARFGVLGDPVELQNTDAVYERLGRLDEAARDRQAAARMPR